ncbi:hypothetical protein ACJX0J_015133 [Zea mays]
MCVLTLRSVCIYNGDPKLFFRSHFVLKKRKGDRTSFALAIHQGDTKSYSTGWDGIHTSMIHASIMHLHLVFSGSTCTIAGIICYTFRDIHYAFQVIITYLLLIVGV